MIKTWLSCGARLALGLGVTALVAGCSGSIETQIDPEDPPVDSEGAQGGNAGMPGGKDGVVSSDCETLPRRFWKLTPEQVQNTLRAIDGSVPAVASALEKSLASTVGFRSVASRLEMTFPHVQDVVGQMDVVARHLVKQPGRVDPCLSAGYDDACVNSAIAAVGEKAFRRPLTSEEVSAYLDFFKQEKALAGNEGAWEEVINAILLSHNTQFRSELGDADAAKAGVVVLTDYEKASALAYTLTDAPPDAELLAAAKDGELNEQTLRAHAERLLATGTTAAGVRRYFEEYLHADLVLEVTKSEKVHPDFTAEIRLDMAEEFGRFVDEVLWSDDASLAAVLAAPYTVTNERLAKYYGLSRGSAKDQWVRTEAPGEIRSGFLTLGAFAASHGRDVDTDIVKRGRFIRERLLCDELPAPPANVNAFSPEPDGQLTNRERMSAHFEKPKCAFCHELMDPLAFGLEHYDSVGRFRTVDPLSKKTLDTSGYLLSTVDGTKKTFANARELAQVLLSTKEAHACFAETLYAFAAGNDKPNVKLCGTETFAKTLEKEGVLAALSNLASNPAFWQRR